MDRLGPFEAAPRLAVAVSGGRDSLALCLLAKDWAARRGGEIIAVTVDHGLRPESSAEAGLVGRWMVALGIAHHTLRWDAPDQLRGVEAAARHARYTLLESFCRAQGVLHLLVGHHRSDQDETREMRRARGSGPVGRAGMAAIREMSWVRVLRPLLAVPRDRITATLWKRGQDWIEDPSNQDVRFERARLRSRKDNSAGMEKLHEPGAARVAHERAAAALAARAVGLHPAGFAVLDIHALCQGPKEISSTVLANAITCVSGGVYPPRGARLDRLWAHLAQNELNGARTLGGCIIRPGGPGKIIVLRELSGVHAPIARPRSTLTWDERFVASVGGGCGDGYILDAVGRGDLSQIFEIEESLRIPRDVCGTLPALFRGNEIAVFPSFQVPADPAANATRSLYVRFAPQKPVSGAVFGNV